LVLMLRLRIFEDTAGHSWGTQVGGGVNRCDVM
jgi:hypothetical protein